MNDIEFLQQYANDVAARIKDIKRDLAPLESGEMKIGERRGNGPWVDTTQRMIDFHKRNIASNERILAALNQRLSGKAA